MGVLAREALVGFEQGEHNHVKQGPGGAPQQPPAVCAAVSLSTQDPCPHPANLGSQPSFLFSTAASLCPCHAHQSPLPAIQPQDSQLGPVISRLKGRSCYSGQEGREAAPFFCGISEPGEHRPGTTLQPTWWGTPHQLLQERGAQRECPVARLLSPWSRISVAG